MLSRFTDFLTSDGEKPWRDREAEFEKGYASKEAMQEAWENGWNVLFTALGSLTGADLEKVIFIRNEGHTVLDALQRQLAPLSPSCWSNRVCRQNVAGARMAKFIDSQGRISPF